MSNWTPFPHSDSDYDFAGDALHAHWAELHAGDKEPYPSDETLQEAWRAFHRGDFEAAVELGDKAGIAGHAVANKATGIYATYLEENESRKISLFKDAVARAERAIEALPDDANAHYFHAFNLGRYSQSISVVKALKQGVGGKIQTSLKRTLELQPDHAEAHTAMGMYHAEILDKVGKLIGSMTYGANANEALEHFEQSLKLTPRSPIAQMEFANGLYLLFGDDRYEEVSELYVKAAESTALDAMERLDVEAAAAELE
jgi:tetratricopeptide (TPR) repeat protein